MINTFKIRVLNLDFILSKVCTKKYTKRGILFLVKKYRCNLHSFEIRCPNCNRKLMVFNLSDFEEANVVTLEKNDLGKHNTETRCFCCKSFVAVDIKKLSTSLQPETLI